MSADEKPMDTPMTPEEFARQLLRAGPRCCEAGCESCHEVASIVGQIAQRDALRDANWQESVKNLSETALVLEEALQDAVVRLTTIADRLNFGQPTPEDIREAYNAAYCGKQRAALMSAKQS